MTTSRSDLKKQDILDELRFVREWIGNPLKIGAVSPSGRWLARAMAAEVDLDRDGMVVELGPGTGVFTRALLDRGIPPERLLLIEYNRDFCRLLGERFPNVRVIQGDAYAIRSHLDALEVGPLAAVVTGLPLLSRPLRRRVELIEACLAAGGPGMPLIQFSYAVQPPVPAGAGDFDVRLARRVLLNLPPATVWVYSRK
ncbi:phosphatidylethanolamine/phosphatidyl-N-methylethanolamine N-methyltransferase [Tepidamorphus gemmatus]|uniref:Phosphatidylethanolamine/phosphatidyl-N-methylethanolamine N-methyltransferase n=1 Tax=Tepidamorphus gemmatus TaxID=747076 RepID=A0A4R3MFK4_9HYPH|nr:rRNA adenine N-6-methyltransferase family protein [Tepidamorphus gemmatus]TCT11942.1 phosphatidylethanolamine/phosphatidyl-N-methylethanolamine N-methyltransferase [Tepidamorphus gemmatus]